MENFIEVKNISFSYKDYEGTQQRRDEVIRDLSMSVKKGEFLALLGHNGSGKSTLAKMFNAMIIPDEGSISVDGMSTTDESLKYDIRRKVGLVLQNPDNQIVASIVEEDVAFGPENLGIEPSQIRKRVDSALKAVDMYNYRSFAPHKLSGGQKQRVAIAGVIAMEPDCIVLDEPTAMLDPKGRSEVMSTIKKLNRENGITVVLITHYMEEAAEADRIIVMDNGSILTQGFPKEVFSKIELLKKHGLDVPGSVEMVHYLKSNGIDIQDVPLDREECIKSLLKILN